MKLTEQMGWLQCPLMDLHEKQKFNRPFQPPTLCTSTHTHTHTHTHTVYRENLRVDRKGDRHTRSEMQEETKVKQRGKQKTVEK